MNGLSNDLKLDCFTILSSSTDCLIPLYQVLSDHLQACCHVPSLSRFPSAKCQAILSLSSAFIPKTRCFFFPISFWVIFSNSPAMQRRGQSRSSGTRKKNKTKNLPPNSKLTIPNSKWLGDSKRLWNLKTWLQTINQKHLS